MKVLITGGAGFIGSYVQAEIRRRGWHPLPFDHHRPTNKDAAVYLGDVANAAHVTEAAAHVEGIIHLAAVLGTQETISNPRPAAEINIMGSLNVFEAAAQYDLPVVYIGVGNHWMRNYGGGAYTISKSCAEDFARMYQAHRGLRATIVRPVNAYGPRQSVAAPFGTSKVRKILPAFICRALSGMPIEVYGDGEQISDMVHVTDVARVLVEALGSGERGPIEVGPVHSVTVNRVAEMVADETRRFTGHDTELVHLPMRPGEVPNATVSADVMTLAKIGMSPTDFIPLEDGIAATVQWYADNEGEGEAWLRPE